ncbi:hypothetical protein E2320_012382 [Naja naja]|nr:hypothetical protein E2320_012382 [Naja naja]
MPSAVRETSRDALQGLLRFGLACFGVKREGATFPPETESHHVPLLIAAKCMSWAASGGRGGRREAASLQKWAANMKGEEVLDLGSLPRPMRASVPDRAKLPLPCSTPCSNCMPVGHCSSF